MSDQDESGESTDDEEELFAEQIEVVGNPIVRIFREYATERPAVVALALVTTVLTPLISLLPPYVIQVTLDGALREGSYGYPLVPQGWLPTGRWGQISLSAGLIVGSALLNRGLGWANAWAWHNFSQHVQHAVRTSAFEKMQRLGMEFFLEQRSGQLLSILNNDVNQLDTFLQRMIQNIIRIAVTFFGTAGVMFLMSWRLALVAVVPIPLMAGMSYHYGSRIREKYQQVRQRVGTINSRVQNSVDGIRVVKSYTNEDLESDRVEAASEGYLEAKWDAITTRIMFFPMMNFVNRVGFALILLVGGYWMVADAPRFGASLTAGTLVAFLLYNRRFTRPIVQAGWLLDQYEDTLASAERVFALLDYPVSITEPDDPIPLEGIEGKVAYEGVSFSYPDAEEAVLSGVDFSVEAGHLVGLVGPTGSGKSTLVKLLLRFYDPDAGTVRVDGHDIREVALEDYRDAFGYVSQDPFLFDGTIRENISYARTDADDGAVEEAARMAGAHEFIVGLEDGYDTEVGEGGAKLSGGQRQRVSLARAVLRDPDVMVLDEATSHVDNETEVLIQNSLDDLIADRTTFAIAHRLSTVRDADTILVLEDGELIERGTHEELLENDGLYANLWRVQVGEVDQLPEAFVERTSRRASGE